MESNNSKIFIILGSFAVLGAGIYFYFKTKKTPTLGGLKTQNTGAGLTNIGGGSTNTGSSNTNTSNTSSTGTNSNEVVLTTSEAVIETAKKIAEAKDLASKIVRLRNMTPLDPSKMSYGEMQIYYLNNYGTEVYLLINKAGLRRFQDMNDEAIRYFNEKLGKLGYYESNGSIVKI
jgi:hypothetical protein